MRFYQVTVFKKPSLPPRGVYLRQAVRRGPVNLKRRCRTCVTLLVHWICRRLRRTAKCIYGLWYLAFQFTREFVPFI
jgi:hypothetical protein